MFILKIVLNNVNNCKDWRRRSLFEQFRLGILPQHTESDMFRNKQPEANIEFVLFVIQVQRMKFILYVICEEYSQFREILYAKVVNVEFNVMLNDENFVYLLINYWKVTAHVY